MKPYVLRSSFADNLLAIKFSREIFFFFIPVTLYLDFFKLVPQIISTCLEKNNNDRR